MKVEFINPFIEAAHDAFQRITNKTLQLGAPSLKSISQTEHDVTVMIGLTGAVGGVVTYSMEIQVATSVASAMMGGIKAEWDDMSESAVGELGNILTGSAVTRLYNRGYECQITPPTIINGKNMPISTSSTHIVSVPLYSEVGNITLDVALKSLR